MSKHPRQPTYTDEHGVERFVENEIVRWLLDNGRLDMNDIARQRHFSDEDRRQFAQLIGYSVSGYYDLSYAEDDPDDV